MEETILTSTLKKQALERRIKMKTERIDKLLDFICRLKRDIEELKINQTLQEL